MTVTMLPRGSGTGETGRMDCLYIVIPAYNESSNIESCVRDWYPVAEKHSAGGTSRLVIVNDGSRDDTWEKLTALAKDRPLLLPLTKENGGHGSAVLFGYRYAIEHGADYVFQTDSDGQTLPEEFEPFWEKRAEFDAVIGERGKRGDGKGRKFVENVVCLLLRLVFGVRVKDANAPFRLMRSSLLAKYIGRLPADFNIPNIMFTAYFVRCGEKVTFLPITFRPRQGGTNSINLRKMIRIGWKALGDFRKLKKEMNNQ